MKAAFMLVALLSGSAFADELADADKLLNARDYAQALPLYTKLAAQGNAAAQFHLGEMHWYGEGVPVDMAKGDEWFRKADAAGYPDAKAALVMTAQRQVRQADISYYLQRYDGADVALAKFNCVQPVIPQHSETTAEIKAVGGSIDAWLVCYNGFVKNLQSVLPAGKAIPGDVANLMTDVEVQQATTRMDRAYAAVHADAKQQADQIIIARDTWQAHTNEWVTTENARTKQVLLVQEKEAQANAAIGHGSAPTPSKH